MQQGILGYWTSQFDMNLSATPILLAVRRLEFGAQFVLPIDFHFFFPIMVITT